MNKIFLVGRVSQPPEARTTGTGLSVTTFSVAVTRRFNRDETDFIRVVTWRGLADNCAKYLVKGQSVAVEGELHIRNYEDSNGVKRQTTEVVADNVEFLAKPTGTGTSSGSGNYSPKSAQNSSPEDDLFASEMGGILMDEEELPF